MERLCATALRPGDAIGVVAPAGRVNPDALERGLAVLAGWGFRPVLGPGLALGHGYLAGTDAERVLDLHTFLADPEMAGVICARGGYGALRLLPLLDWDLVRRQPKVLVGFSDIAALHLALWQRARLVSFHGPLLEVHEEEMPAYNAAGLRRALTATEALGEVPLPADLPAPPATLVPGVARGPLLGGNLEVLTRLVGTPYLPDLRGAILLLEDVDEPPYRMDRMLMHLRLSGVLDGVAGVLFGYSPSCEQGPSDRPSLTLPEVLTELLVPLGKPLLYGFPCGHGRHRATLPLGTLVELDAGRARLTILEPALRARG